MIWVVTSGNVVGIGLAAIAAVLRTIRPGLRAGPLVCRGAVTGTLVPLSAGLRVGTSASRTSTATTSDSGSAGHSL